MARPMPDPAPVTKATRVASGSRLREPLQLGLLERPVLDAELLRLGDRRVRRHRLGAAHHVDRVDVELAGDAGRLLVRRRTRTCRRRGRARSPGRRRASAGSRARRGARSRRGSRRGRRRAARAAGRRPSSSGAVGGRSRTSGRTFVRRKWSGHDVPSAASRAQLLRGRQKSSTTSLSVKWPTCGRSVEASPRITGASAAARARRSAAGSGSKPGDDGAERLGRAAGVEERLRRCG